MTDAERLRALAARYDMTATERYEADAEAFYRETGFMAPGKDVPMAMGGQDEQERRAAHERWIAARNAQQQADILAGAAALEAQARREGERAPLACINCGEANDGGYETPSVGPFCSLCWDELRAALSPAGTAKEEDRG
jgi:hypothetical protein